MQAATREAYMVRNRDDIAIKTIFGHFIRELEIAKKLHDSGKSVSGEPDDGRQGIISALSAVHHLIRELDHSRPPALAQPLYRLRMALEDLEDGKRHNLLTPRKISKTAIENREFQTLRAYAAFALDWMIKNGQPKQQSADQIANLLNRAGYSKRGRDPQITGRTIIGWRDRAKSEDPNEDWIARRYRNLQKHVSADVEDIHAAVKLLLGKIRETIPPQQNT
jgi:hypothetical protein